MSIITHAFPPAPLASFYARVLIQKVEQLFGNTRGRGGSVRGMAMSIITHAFPPAMMVREE